jgi:hypothetical protein
MVINIEWRIDAHHCNFPEAFLFDDLCLFQDLFVFDWADFCAVNLHATRYLSTVAVNNCPQLAGSVTLLRAYFTLLQGWWKIYKRRGIRQVAPTSQTNNGHAVEP